MSIYTALNTERPVICYSVLHQVRKGISTQDYIKTMQDLHRLVAEESAKVETTWREFLADVRAKAVQASRGNLSQFLTTPLNSDVNEIQKIIADQTTHISNQILPNSRYGIISATEGRFVWTGGSSAVKKLHRAGRKYLQELSFKLGKGSTEIFESNFFLEGGLNLDIVEHIVRDRIGIYTPVHGKHIKEFTSYAYAAHNLVYLKGELAARADVYESALFFSKGETKYAPFRNGLIEFLDQVFAKAPLSHCSVWQRKLGLGVGREFVVRLRHGEGDVFKPIVTALQQFKQKEFVPRALLNGHLLVKQLIPAT